MDDETREWLKSGAHIDSFGKVTIDMPLYPKDRLMLLRTVALQIEDSAGWLKAGSKEQAKLMEALALIVQAIRVLEAPRPAARWAGKE